MRFASFDVDCQKTFTTLCPNELPVPKGHLIVDELNRQAAFCDYRIGSKDAHHPNAVWCASDEHPMLSACERVNAAHYWPAHAIVGTEGFDLLDGLPKPLDYDYFVWKGIELDVHPYGACYHDLAERRSTGVIEYLKHHDVSHVIVGGLTLDYCVQTTVLQLRKAGLDVWVNLAATASVDEHTGQTAISQMKQHGVRFLESASQIEDWQS